MKKQCTVKELMRFFDALDPNMAVVIEEKETEKDDLQYHEFKVYMDAHDVYDHWEELKKAASRMKLIDQFLYDDKMLRDQELSFNEKPF